MTDTASTGAPKKPAPWKIWHPILAGATLRDRLLACLGALCGIGLTGLLCALGTGGNIHLPLLVAPMGASAVLVFAVPSSPLAQPWPTIGGNVISAAVGLIVAHYVPDRALAAGIAVALAIAAMSFLRCLHPPGGAAALIAAFGGPLVDTTGFLFPLIPVGINSVLLVGFGLIFHRLRGKSYPHRVAAVTPARGEADTPPALRTGVRPEDIDRALEVMGESFDISREDIERLIREVEKRALVRANPDLTCADIMSRDVITIDRSANPAAARSYLLSHNIRTLPVIDAQRHVLGCVGFHSLQRPASRVEDMMEPALIVRLDTPAMELIGDVSDGSRHAVFVVDDEDRLRGIVTQTDLLAAVSTAKITQKAA
jgi:CBS domain-containing membrane protein